MVGVRQTLSPSCLSHSKLTQDSRMESPIPILPLPTPDAETEKLIRMKDEEVSRATGEEQRLGGEGSGPSYHVSHSTPHCSCLTFS